MVRGPQFEKRCTKTLLHFYCYKFYRCCCQFPSQSLSDRKLRLLSSFSSSPSCTPTLFSSFFSSSSSSFSSSSSSSRARIEQMSPCSKLLNLSCPHFLGQPVLGLFCENKKLCVCKDRRFRVKKYGGGG